MNGCLPFFSILSFLPNSSRTSPTLQLRLCFSLQCILACLLPLSLQSLVDRLCPRYPLSLTQLSSLLSAPTTLAMHIFFPTLTVTFVGHHSHVCVSAPPSLLLSPLLPLTSGVSVIGTSSLPSATAF